MIARVSNHDGYFHIHAQDADKMISTDPSETRTKESSICASIKVRKTLVHNESEGGFGSLRWDSERMHHRPVWISFLKDLSKSTSAGTRKRVNYACIG